MPRTLKVKRQKVIFFLHIPRTAGTVIRHWIHQNYRNPQILFLKGGESGFDSAWGDLTSRQRSSIRVVYGHFFYGLHSRMGPHIDPVYFALVRHPIQRLASFYHLLRDVDSPEYPRGKGIFDGNPLHPYAMKLSLDEFLGLDFSVEFNNLQARMIAGLKFEQRPFGKMTNLDFITAKARVEEDFAFVGTSDRLFSSMKFIGDMFGWKEPKFDEVKFNTAAKPWNVEIEEGTLGRVISRNVIDWLLYRFVLQRQIQAEWEQGKI
jgi:hypothetical protein